MGVDIQNTGALHSNVVTYAGNVRPSIVLKKGISYISGDGEPETPYVIE